MEQVKLTPEEFSLAVHVANARFLEANLRGYKDKLFDKSYYDGFAIHLWGCIGELAVSKWMNIPWKASINKFKDAPDVGEDIEVRHRLNAKHDLIIRNGDDPDRYYFLTTGDAPNVNIVGYIQGKEGMKDQYKAAHGGYKIAYFVPQAILHAPGTYMGNIGTGAVATEQSITESVSARLERKYGHKYSRI